MRIQQRLVESLEGLDYRRTRVRLLLGTDEFIEHEARVAFGPRHVRRLADDLRRLGLEPELFVVAGAGARANPPFEDQAYRDAGARVVTIEEALELDALDVVHALKEPTSYEASLRGPFLRLGALHLASKPPGVCELAERKNFAAILDGATVGNCSYRLTDGDRTPIVGSMSRFAGSVAAKKAVAAVRKAGIGPGKVVIVGGGIAGRAAIRQVEPITSKLIVVEPWEPMRDRLSQFLPDLGFADFEIVETLEDEAMDDAVAIVFAHRSGAKAAEKVCNYEQIRRMRLGAAISDIAIDQGGAIAHDAYDETDDVVVARAKYMQLLGDDYAYYAEVNMPREEPHDASEEHGDASLPYVTALLALVAHTGSPAAVVERLLEKSVRICRQDDPVDSSADVDPLLDAFEQDLRNGVQLAMVDGKVAITDPDIARSGHLAEWVYSCAGD